MPDVMKTVGRYEILRELGRGGMALVYLARQTDLDRFVALKELGAFHASDASFAQRFLRESRVAGSLSHPNIVTVHDYFEHDGTPYIAMEYVERGSLRPYVGRMTLAQMGGVLEGLLAGLTNAEQNGIVHRDLKPENLMVTADGRVKIADFGIAKATTKMQTGAFLTATGTTVGTPTYMAPEQAMAQDIGPWTDLYSVGCMAFELFTGKVPFHDSDAPMAILLRHVNEPIAPVKSIDASIDPAISDWIERLLIKDPRERTQSAADAWDDFEEIIIGLLGPRWRRSARLVERVEDVDTPNPLTPAPFEGTSAGAPASDEFQSFAWGRPADTPPAPAAATPGPYTPPPQDLPPGPMGETPAPEAPPAPEPEAPVAPASDEPVADSGFVTFGAPAPPPPTDALIPPAEAPPAEPEPEPEPPEPVQSFETYVAPPPLRPPEVEPGTDALQGVPEPAPEPPAPEPEPEPEPEPVAAEPAAPEPEPVAAAPEPAAAEPAPRDLGATVMPEALRERPAPAAPAEPRPERPSRAFPIAVAAGALVAVVLGFLIGGSGGGDDAGGGGALTATAASAGTAVKVPEGWARLASPPDVPGLSLSEPVAMAPAGADGGTAVIIGNAGDGAANSTLLAQAFLQALGEVPEPSAAVQVGAGMQAYRYDGLAPRGFDRSVTVYAAPTSAGVATLACLAPEGEAEAFAPTCDQIANTLETSAGEPLPVGPSKTYASAVSKALGALTKADRSGQARLRSAKTPQAQATAARSLDGAYAKAAKALAGQQLSPADRGANTRLVRALRQTSGAYGKAASAAAKRNKGAFRRSGGDVRRGREAVSGALAGLKDAGYDVAS